MKKVVITGADGFIGRYCLPMLVARGYDVHAVSIVPHPENEDGIEWHTTDLLNPASAESLFASVRPTHVLHFAWYTRPGEYWTSLENIRWVNASLNMLQSFARYGGSRFVAAGSSAEYKWDTDRYFETSTPQEPATLYGSSKHALHLLLEAFCRQTGISGAWGRVFFLYGPYEYPQRLVPSVICSLLRNETARCSHGNQIRDFLYVEDVADAFVTLLESEFTGAVNIASGKGLRIREIVETIGTLLERKQLIQFGAVPVPEHDPPSLIADTGRLESIGWHARWSLERGLRRTIEWWEKQPDCQKEHSR